LIASFGTIQQRRRRKHQEFGSPVRDSVISRDDPEHVSSSNRQHIAEAANTMRERG
jgi:hypothetical protein